MTFREAIVETGLRFISLMLALVFLALPAKLLRTYFFPDGLNGTILLFVIVLLVCSSFFVLITYVSAPLRYWHDHEMADAERRLRDKFQPE